MADLRSFTTAEASPETLRAIRLLMHDAFEGHFAEEDWDHTTGGRHLVIYEEGVLASHAAVIERVIEVAGRRFRTGYVEGVGTSPALQSRGLGSIAMGAANDYIRSHFELGALGTDAHRFYERLGWERWLGPTYVRRGTGLERTAEEDDGIMVLRFGPSRDARLDASISCEERPGEDW